MDAALRTSSRQHTRKRITIMFTLGYTYFVYLFRSLPRELRDEIYKYTIDDLLETLSRRRYVYFVQPQRMPDEMPMKLDMTMVMHTMASLEELAPYGSCEVKELCPGYFGELNMICEREQEAVYSGQPSFVRIGRVNPKEGWNENTIRQRRAKNELWAMAFGSLLRERVPDGLQGMFGHLRQLNERGGAYSGRPLRPKLV
ncbi:hypothetical protein LTR17_017065 [Elasticomyces elasticus]|nr:hypothetical protein LTR17_017065 [Elasticomyces elasticus]